MALLGKKTPEEPVLLERELRTLSQLNNTAHAWLGPRYEWYNKIRNANREGLARLLEGKSLEEQMEATRSALTLVMRTLNSGLVLAFNSTVEGVKNAGELPEGWPEKIDMPDRNNPPVTGAGQDALIISYMPLKFLNLSKLVRDKGKGIDWYAEALVKKLFFKVIGFYSDPSNWDRQRLGFFFEGLDSDAELADVSARLGPVKTELDLLVSNLQSFKFGAAPRNRSQSGISNTLEETFDITDKELLDDLYFQSLLTNGMITFLFRYCVTLTSLAPSPRSARAVAQIFLPALEKATELKVMFQGSFSLEREKIRLRQEYVAWYKKLESLPAVETVKIKGKPTRKINYSNRLIESAGYPIAPKLNERQAKPWLALYKQGFSAGEENPSRGCAILLEILNTVFRMTGYAAEGKHKLSAALRTQADEEEKLGQRQVALKKKKLDEAKRNKLKSARKFKVLEQDEMARTVEGEAAQLEAEGTQEIERMEQAIAKRREAKVEIAKNMDIAAQEEKKRTAGHNAGAIFALLVSTDPEGTLQAEFLTHLLEQIQDSKDDYYYELYRHLFMVMPTLSPMQKMVVRKAVESRVELEDGEMELSEEETQAYEYELANLKDGLEKQVPQLMEYKFIQGPVNVTLAKLLELGVTGAGFSLILQLPFAGPNKQAAKLPSPIAKQILLLNQMTHPFAEQDLVLPNVDASAPPAKRLNLSRLAKAV